MSTKFGHVCAFARWFPKDHWTFLGPGNEKWLDSHVNRTIGEWNRAQEMMLSFAESGHPTFRGTRPLERGTSKSKGGGKLSFRKTGETHNAELLHRTVTAVNQLSIYEAVSSWCYNQTGPETSLSAVTTTQPVPETLVSCSPNTQQETN